MIGKLKGILLVSVLLTLHLMSFTPATAQVKWHTIEQAAEAKIGEKLYFIDFYTSWCGYCKKMDRETFSDATVAKILNQYYYPVKFNAEGSNTFTWFGQTYKPATAGRNRTHQFAQGLQGYPTFVICTADGKALQAIPGFMSAKDFTVVLWYLASGDYQRYSYEQYQKIFNKDIRPSMEKALR
jgi:thioredoxin-related protein